MYNQTFVDQTLVTQVIKLEKCNESRLEPFKSAKPGIGPMKTNDIKKR